jgi:hypothetical protein
MPPFYLCLAESVSGYLMVGEFRGTIIGATRVFSTPEFKCSTPVFFPDLHNLY